MDEKVDKKLFTEIADSLGKNFNMHLLDNKKGVYVDGIGTDHSALHSNIFPVVFGLVSEPNKRVIAEFIKSRGMACSVYGAQFLLDAVYDLHESQYGLELLTSVSSRSWYNMIRSGSTITMEAWDKAYKPNLDLNHAWGAAPANIIPHRLMGIEPLEPGFGKIRIKPQPGSLEHAEIKYPTIRGAVTASFENKPGRSFILDFSVPANTSVDIWLPHYSDSEIIKLNGESFSAEISGDFVILRNIGSGKNRAEVRWIKEGKYKLPGI